jgi:ribose transport system substrate-binding protein
VAVLEGAPNAFNGIQRRLGFEDAMNAAGMKIVSSQSGYWETDKANQVAAALLTEHPDLKAFLCANDSMALGVVAALRAAGKLGEVFVVGYDNIAAVQQLLEDGHVLATVDQHADQLAVFGIEYALEMLEGGATPEDRETPVDLVTAQQLAE